MTAYIYITKGSLSWVSCSFTPGGAAGCPPQTHTMTKLVNYNAKTGDVITVPAATGGKDVTGTVKESYANSVLLENETGLSRSYHYDTLTAREAYYVDLPSDPNAPKNFTKVTKDNVATGDRVKSLTSRTIYAVRDIYGDGVKLVNEETGQPASYTWTALRGLEFIHYETVTKEV